MIEITVLMDDGSEVLLEGIVGIQAGAGALIYSDFKNQTHGISYVAMESFTTRNLSDEEILDHKNSEYADWYRAQVEAEQALVKQNV